MRNERPHADHSHVFLLEKQQVVGEVVKGLERQSDHHACAGLVAEFQQRVDAVQPRLEVVLRVARVNLII